MNIYLKYNSIKENAIKNIYIYEYYSHCIDCEIYEHFNQIITPQRKDNNELSFYFPYIIRQEKTRYALIKIKTKEYMEYFEIKVNVQGKIYYLKNNIPMVIDYIRPGDLFYFFINATKYNELITQFTFNKRNDNIEPFKYLIINEYEDKNIVTFIKSTNQTYEIKSEENEYYLTNYKINISYKPSSPLTKYIAFILEANCDIKHLSTKVNVGGGCYEFNKNINISKIIANTTYYLPIKISMFQEIEMNIICDDNISSNKPFKYVNIYEKQKKDDNIYNKYHHQTIIVYKKSGKFHQYFSYSIDNFTTNYIMIELIPNCNIDILFLEYEIKAINYNLFKGESKYLNKVIKNTPYYYYISSKQYQQVNIKLTMDYKGNIPFEFVEIYELIDKDKFNSAKKYINKTINLVKDDSNNILKSTFNYMIESIYINYIIIKILPKCDLDFLNIKMNNGGGYYELEVNTTKNITNLYSDFSYYFLILCSKEEKVNFKFIINSNETKQPFNVLNVYEYSNKNNPSIYLVHTSEKFNFKKKENNSMILMSYKAKNNFTNYIGLEMIPNYDINYIECSIEVEKVILREKNTNSFSVEKILTIVLIVIVFITTIIFIIYLKKNCTKSSSNSIEDIYEKNKGNITKNKKFELNLLD